jgi:hypothetical protein
LRRAAKVEAAGIEPASVFTRKEPSGVPRGVPRGAPRLARHLCRMCFALFIAAGSFLSVRERVAKILPEPFTTGPMRALPTVPIKEVTPVMS